MSTQTNPMVREPNVIDERDADEVIYRVSVAAFAYYPEKSDEEDGYDVAEDIDWAIEPVLALDPEVIAALRDRIREAIVDPNADRRAFIRDMKALPAV